jgi:hypothetical protein
VRSWLGLGFSSIEIQKFQDSLTAFERVCEGDRDGVKQARKAASIMKTLNQTKLLKKFEELIRKCEEMTPGKRFL